MLAMGLGHVRGISRMPTPAIVADVRGHALTAMEDLDGRRGTVRVDELVQELVGDGVVVAVDVDVVVDVDACVDRPLADDEGLGRERTECGLIELDEELAPAGAIDAHDLRVERLQELADARVEGGEGEEALVPEAREDTSLSDLNPDLRLRFVAGTFGASVQYDGVVVLREVFVGALDAGLVATRDGDAALELVGDHDLGDAAEEGEGALVAADPVGDLFGARGFSVGVVGCPQHGDEELDLDDLAGRGIDDRGLLARVVDEQLLAGAMDLPHRQAAVLQPPAVDLAVLRVPVPVWVLLEILEVEQLQRDAGLATFAMDVRAVRPRPRGALGDRDVRTRVEPRLERFFGQRLDGRPVEPGLLGLIQHEADGAEADAQALGHLAVGPAQHPLLSEDLADLSHG